MINKEISLQFEQRMLKLWEELKGKTRDEKLPFGLANELVVAAVPLLQ
jgi:hypothetical protein